MLHQTLLDIDDLHQFSDQSTFTQNIPVEWVESALTLTQKATIRRRRLPSDQVLWLVLGMSLFRDEPIGDVARRLNICSKDWRMTVYWRKAVSLLLVSVWELNRWSGCFAKQVLTGEENVIPMMIGMGYRC